jgi:hypothetical protein
MWAPSLGQKPFSLGNPTGVQQALDENNHDVPFQKLMDWFGQGNSNFAMSTMGRYIASRQGELDNRFASDSAANVAKIAQQTTDHNAQLAQLQGALDALTKGGNQADPNWQNNYNLARTNLERFKATAFKPDDQLTYDTWLGQQANGLGQGFNQLTAAQRGANPGNFMIRRNLW